MSLNPSVCSPGLLNSFPSVVLSKLSAMQPSSSDSGFFQEAPVLLNQFNDDVAFRRAFKRRCLTPPTLH